MIPTRIFPANFEVERDERDDGNAIFAVAVASLVGIAVVALIVALAVLVRCVL